MNQIVSNVGIESIDWQTKASSDVNFPRDKSYHPMVRRTVSALDRLMKRDQSIAHRVHQFASPKIVDRSITYPENYQGICRRTRKLLRTAKNRSKSSKELFDSAESLLDHVVNDYQLFNEFRYSLAKV